MEDDSWGRRGWEEDGDYGGGGKWEEAGAESGSKSPDVVGCEAGKEEGGLDFGYRLDLWGLLAFVQFHAIYMSTTAPVEIIFFNHSAK